MATLAKARHFDYLKKHADYVEGILSWEGFEQKVSWWRRTLLEDPDGVTVGCRKTVESLLEGLFENDPEVSGLKLRDMIDIAEDEGIIGKRTALQCAEIRRIGNLGAHEPTVKVVDAKNSLTLLDDVLRWFVAENCGSEDFDPNPREFADDIVVTEGRESIASLNKRAITAAVLSEDKSIERAAANASNKARAYDATANEALDKLDDILKQIESADVGDAGKFRAIEACNEKASALARATKDIVQTLDATSDKIDEILSEHDYVKYTNRTASLMSQAAAGPYTIMSVFPSGSPRKARSRKASRLTSRLQADRFCTSIMRQRAG